MADWLEASDGALFRAEHLIEVATASTASYGKTAVFAWIAPDGRRRRVSDEDAPIQIAKLHALITSGLAGPEPLVSVGVLHGRLRLDLSVRVQRARPPATPLNAYDPGHPRYNPQAKGAADFAPEGSLYVNQSRSRVHRIPTCAGSRPQLITPAEARTEGLEPCAQCQPVLPPPPPDPSTNPGKTTVIG